MICLGLSIYLDDQSAGRDGSGHQGDLQLRWEMSDGGASGSLVPVVGKGKTEGLGPEPEEYTDALLTEGLRESSSHRMSEQEGPREFI